jgi:hypothetical protein
MYWTYNLGKYGYTVHTTPILCHHGNDQPVNAVWGNNLYFGNRTEHTVEGSIPDEVMDFLVHLILPAAL